MRGVGDPGIIGRDRPRGHRRRPEDAEAVERARGRRGRLARGGVRPGRVLVGRRRAGERDDLAQHVDEQPRQREIRPGRVGGDVEQHDEALAAPVGGDQRRAVGEARPGLGGEARLGLGEDLPRDRDLGRRGEAEERARRARTAARRLGVSQDRAPPSVRPPRRSSVGVRSSAVAASRAPAKRISTPPFSTNCASASWAGPAAHAHVGERERRRLFRDEGDDRVGRAVAPLADFGEGRQRARQIIGRRQQRLGGVGARPRGDRDAPPLPAFVEQRQAPAERSSAIVSSRRRCAIRSADRISPSRRARRRNRSRSRRS